MSFEARLKERYTRAKVTDIAANAMLQVKAQKLAEVVGTQKPPLTHAGLQDGFDRAVKNGLDQKEAERLIILVHRRGFIETVNDKPRFDKLIEGMLVGLGGLRDELASGGASGEIIKIIPRELREKLTEPQIKAVVAAVIDYGVTLIDYFRTALTSAAAQPDTGAGRTVAVAQLHGVMDAYERFEKDAMNPLVGIDPNG